MATSRCAVAAVLAAAVAGCGPRDPGPGTIQLRWRLGFGVACQHAAAEVDTVTVRVIDTAEQPIVSQSFGCADAVATTGTGTTATGTTGTGDSVIVTGPLLLPGVYRATVEAGQGAGFTAARFLGGVTGILVQAGQVTDIGTVALAKLTPDQTPGGLKISWRFDSGLCGQNNVRDVHLQLWRDLVFDEHSRTYPCDVPEGFVHVDVRAAEYAVVAEGLDEDGLVVRRGTREGVVIAVGQTTSLIDDQAIILSSQL